MRFAFNVIVNSYGAQPTTPGFRIFFQLKRASRKPFHFNMCFFNQSASCVLGDCKFTCDAVDRAHTPGLFPKKMRLAGILPHSLSIVFSQAICVLRWEVIVNLNCDEANCSLTPNIFPRKTRLAGGIPRGSHCHCKFSFVPKPGRKPNLDKGTLYRRCWVIWFSVPHNPRIALVWKRNFKTHVTPKGWDVKGGIPQTACWRLGCGEARQTLKRDRAIPKTTAVEGRERND